MSSAVDEDLAGRLAEAERSFEEIERAMADPNLLADPSRYEEASRRHAGLRPLVVSYRAMLEAGQEAQEALELAEEEADLVLAGELRRLAAEKREEAGGLADELKEALTPKDPDDPKDVIMEIRAAAGGAEASLWAGDLLRMYQRYADLHGLVLEPIDSSAAEAGGFSTVVFAVKGRGAYRRLKHEAGVHRVQRVPKTESRGRVHTSTATVAVMPEAEEVEVSIDPGELEISTFRSSGPGGQSVNTTDSAVRITHLPSGLVVTCQDEKSQYQNKERALRVLRARLYQREAAARNEERAEGRRSQIGRGKRSEKIRTYNFRENRVTDHRIGLTVNRLSQILEGGLDRLVEALAADESARRLREGG